MKYSQRWTFWGMLLIGLIVVGGFLLHPRGISSAEAESITARSLGMEIAQEPRPPEATPTNTESADNDGMEVEVDGVVFASWSDYFRSAYFQQNGKRCGTKLKGELSTLLATPNDCSLQRTIIQATYWPNEVYVIPIVFHIILTSDGTGDIPDERIHDQVRVLNEDYQAIAETMGADGVNTHVYFDLVGITRTVNDRWFDDQGEEEFKSALGWDQRRFLNVYTNSASGYLGYSYLPQEASGTVQDGVVMLYEVIGGRNLPGADVYDQGRTLVHEIGHYLGLLHTFEGYACENGYEAGDLISDTPSEDTEHFGCTPSSTCGTPDDIHNYMNYTDDACMRWFTREQANRAVCSLLNYRPQLYQIAALNVTQQPSAAQIAPGGRLTYTIEVRNTGTIDLRSRIVDILPEQIMTDTTTLGAITPFSRTLEWSAVITAPGGTWTETVAVTVSTGFTGTITNLVQVSTVEGVTGAYSTTVGVHEPGWRDLFMPLLHR